MGEIDTYLGFIGGSGLESLISEEERFRNIKTMHNIFTPYGRISELQIGEIDNKKVYFISRHGRNREYSPNEVPYKAYLWLFANLKIVDPFLYEKNGIVELQQKDYQIRFPHTVGERGVDLREIDELNFKAISEVQDKMADHVFAFSATGSFDETVPLGAFVVIDSVSRGKGDGPMPLPYPDMPHPVPEISFEKGGIDFLKKIGASIGLDIRQGPYVLNTWSEAFESAREVAEFQAVPRAYAAMYKVIESFRNGKFPARAIYRFLNYVSDGALETFYNEINFPGSEHLTAAGMQAGMTAHDAILGTQLGLKFNTIACPVNWGVGMDSNKFGRPITAYLKKTLDEMEVDFNKVDHNLTTHVMKAYGPHIKRFVGEIIRNYN